MIKLLKKTEFLLIIIIFVFMHIGVSYANDYLQDYKGNVKLIEEIENNDDLGFSLQDLEIEFGKFDESDRQILGDISENDELIDIDEESVRYKYTLEGSKACITTGIKDKESGYFLFLYLENGCKARIWKNDEIYNYTIDDTMGNLIFISEKGDYTVLLAEKESDFYDRYARYEFSIASPDIEELLSEGFDSEIRLSYNEGKDEFEYSYNDVIVVSSNKPFGMTVNNGFRFKINENNAIIDRLYKDNNLLDSLDYYNLAEPEGKYELTILARYSTYGIKKFSFTFEIGDEFYSNERLINVPIGLKLLEITRDGRKESRYRNLTKRVIELERDGKYEITYITEDDKVELSQGYDIDSNRHLIDITDDVANKKVRNKVLINKIKDGVSYYVIKNGNKYGEIEELSDNGSYYINARDKFGNIVECYFRIEWQVDMESIFFVVGVVLLIALFIIRKKYNFDFI